MKKRLSFLTEDGKKHYDGTILIEIEESVYPLMNLEELQPILDSLGFNEIWVVGKQMSLNKPEIVNTNNKEENKS